MQSYYNIRLNMPVFSSYFNSTSSSEYISSKNLLDTQLRAHLNEQKEIKDIELLDTKGTVVYSVGQEGVEIEAEVGKQFSDPTGQVLRNGREQAFIGDLFAAKNNNGTVSSEFLAIAPLFDLNKNQFIGSVVLEVSSDQFYSIIQDTTGLGETGETLLAEKDSSTTVTYLNPLRFDGGAAFNRKVVVDGNIAMPAINAAGGQKGSGLSVDYRGQKVLAAWRYIPSRNWGLVTKIDFSEATIPASNLASAAFMIGAITICLILIFVWFFARKLSEPIILLESVTNNIRNGIFSMGPVDRKLQKRKDEIGSLSRSFSQMVLELKNSYGNLEQKVNNRTKELQEAQSRDEALLTSIGEGIIATDNYGAVIFMNDSAKKILGLENQNMEKKMLVDVVDMVDEKGNKVEAKDRILNKILADRKRITTSIETPYYYVRANGEKFPAAITATPIILDDKLLGVINVFRDVTREKELDVTKSEFISIASHQLKTPITILRWHSEALLESKSNPPNKYQKDHLESIHNATMRMIDLTSSLLRVTRIELGRLALNITPIKFSEIISGSISNLEIKIKEKSLKIEEKLAEIPLVNADKEVFVAIVQNLLTNAIKYSNNDGIITVSLSENKDRVLFSVSDNGLGIPQDFQYRIFEKFSRAPNAIIADPNGNGLGLYIIKQLIELVGGKIWFVSEENKGTTFFVDLPKLWTQKKEATEDSG